MHRKILKLVALAVAIIFIVQTVPVYAVSFHESDLQQENTLLVRRDISMPFYQYSDSAMQNHSLARSRLMFSFASQTDSLNHLRQILLKKGISPQSLPSSVDWSNYLPPIESQGYQGSCVGWATGYYYRTALETKEERWNNEDIMHIMSPAWVYNQINGGYDAGSWQKNAMDLFVKKGAATWGIMPYDDTDYLTQPQQWQIDQASVFKGKDTQWLTNKYWHEQLTDTDIETLKMYLSSNGPIVVALYTAQPFFDVCRNTTLTLSSSVCVMSPDMYDGISNFGGHAVILTGYDDKVFYVDKSGNKHYGAFKMVNSWGIDWGYSGLVYISYDFAKRYFKGDVYTIDDEKNPKNFLVAFYPYKKYAYPGQTFYMRVMIRPVGGFTGTVSLNFINPYPKFVHLSYTSTDVYVSSGTDIYISATITSTMALGDYTLGVRSSSGNISHEAYTHIYVLPKIKSYTVYTRRPLGIAYVGGKVVVAYPSGLMIYDTLTKEWIHRYADTALFMGVYSGKIYFSSYEDGLKIYDPKTDGFVDTNENEWVYDVSCSGGVCYAADYYGITRSYDGIKYEYIYRRKVKDDSGNYIYNGIATSVYGTDKDIYAVIDYNKIIVSHDGGFSWSYTENNPNGVIYDIYGDGKIIIVASSQGIWLSGDDGKTWTKTRYGKAYRLLYDNSRFYASINGSVYESLDGVSWQQTNIVGDVWFKGESVVVSADNSMIYINGKSIHVPFATGSAYVSAILPSEDGYIIVSRGSIFKIQGESVYRVERGDFAGGAVLGGKYYALDYDGTLYESEDGITWDKTYTFSGNVVKLFSAGEKLFVYTFDDSGNGTLYMGDGNAFTPVYTLSKADKKLYVNGVAYYKGYYLFATDNGLVFYKDGTTKVVYPGVYQGRYRSGKSVADVVVDGDKIYAVMNIPAPSSLENIRDAEGRQLYVSNDGGNTFNLAMTHRFANFVFKIRKSDDGTLYIFTDRGIWVSHDEGAHWMHAYYGNDDNYHSNYWWGNDLLVTASNILFGGNTTPVMMAKPISHLSVYIVRHDISGNVIGMTEVNGGYYEPIDVTENGVVKVYVDGQKIYDGEEKEWTYHWDHLYANHVVDLYYPTGAIDVYVKHTEGGSVQPTGTVTVQYGGTLHLQITASEGYHIKAIQVDGKDLWKADDCSVRSLAYDIDNVKDNITVDILFEKDAFELNINVSEGGTASPSGTVTVPCGSSISITITASPKYFVGSIIDNGEEVYKVNSIDSAITSTTYIVSNIHEDHSIYISFSKGEFVIQATYTLGGAISPTSTIVKLNGSATFTITASEGYHIKVVYVDGTPVFTPTNCHTSTYTYTFEKVSEDHTIYAEFEKNTFTVTATWEGEGIVTPTTATVPCGGTATVQITASVGNHIEMITVNGATISVPPMSASYTLTFTDIHEDKEVHVVFKDNFATITAIAGDGGSITPSGTFKVKIGDTVQFTIKADKGHYVDEIVIDGKLFHKGKPGETYMILNWKVKGDTKIEVTFAKEIYSVIATAGEGGSISPSGTQTLPYGATATYTITASEGYHIGTISVNGKAIYTGSSNDDDAYTLTVKVEGDTTIEATFAKDTYTIEAIAGEGGSISPSGEVYVVYGESITFYITPEEGYKIKDVKVDGESIGAVEEYTFDNVNASHTIEAEFEKKETVIVLRPGETYYWVNGQMSEMDVAPFIDPRYNRTVVPLRFVAEAMGLQVEWNGETREISITGYVQGEYTELIIPMRNLKKVKVNLRGKEEYLYESDGRVYIGGEERNLEKMGLGKPVIYHNRTMVPIRFIAEIFGAKVDWDGETRTIYITIAN